MSSDTIRVLIACITIYMFAVYIYRRYSAYVQPPIQLIQQVTDTNTAFSIGSISNSSDIERLLEIIANNQVVSNYEHADFVALLTSLRRLIHLDLPLCRTNVHFALLVVYMWKSFPSFIHHFLSTIIRNPTIDLLMLGSADNCLVIQSQYRQTNVYIQCVDPDTLIFFITDGLCSEWKCNAHDFYHAFKYFKARFRNDPYKMINVKPMLGSMFRDYISCYTHWAYGDIDMLYGNFETLYPTALANKYDVITFSHDLHTFLFMRGQLTILKNARRLVSLWTQMTRFSTSVAFSAAMKEPDRIEHAIDEGDFSASVIDHGNVTWIQIPGLHLSDWDVIPSKSEISVSTGTPPSVTIQRVNEIKKSNDYTTLDESTFHNMYETKLLRGTACTQQTWTIVDERRCFNYTDQLSDGYGIVIMREPKQKKVMIGTVLVGTKEYLLFHFMVIKRRFNWKAMPLNGVYRINMTGISKDKWW